MIYIKPAPTLPRAPSAAPGVSKVCGAAACGAGTRTVVARALVALAVAALAACSTTGGAPSSGGRPAPANLRLSTNDRFCSDAQAQVSATTVPSITVVHTDFQAFVVSKPKPRPLETEQYVWYEDDAHTRPKMVSCKMKTSDHLLVEYGPKASGGNVSCAALNERTVQLVRGSLTRAERQRLKFARGTRIVYDEDLLTGDGPTWLAPFPVLYVGPEGALHVKSKSMKNDWSDPKLATAPLLVRGTRYCHMVAPEYLKRVLLGDVTP